MKSNRLKVSNLLSTIFDESDITTLKTRAIETYNEKILTTEFWKELLTNYIKLSYSKIVFNELVERFLLESDNDVVVAFNLYRDFLEKQPYASALLEQIIAETNVNEYSNIDELASKLFPRFKYTKSSGQIGSRLYDALIMKAFSLDYAELQAIDEFLSDLHTEVVAYNRILAIDFYRKMLKLQTKKSAI